MCFNKLKPNDSDEESCRYFKLPQDGKELRAEYQKIFWKTKVDWEKRTHIFWLTGV